MTLDSFQRSISFSNVAAGLAHVMALADDRYEGAMLRTAMQLREQETEWAFLSACLVLLERPHEPRPPRQYPGLALAEEWLSLAEIRARFTAVADKVQLKTQGSHPSNLVFNSALGERRDTQAPVLGSEFAETIVYFELSSHRSPDMDHRPAISIGLPAYGSIADAAADWCRGKRVRYSGDFHDRGRFVVVAPEVRARIERVRVQDGRLSIDVRTNKHTSGELQLLFAASSQWGMDGPSIPAPPLPLVPSSDNHHEVELPADAAIINAFVVDSKNNVVAHFSSWRQQLEPVDVRAVVARAAESDIAAGENEHVEFKPWLNKSDQKNTKMHELIKTVIAFANTEGGRLYVGVEDDGSPQGLSPLAGIGPGPKEMLEAVREMLEREFRNNIVPVPPFSIEPITAFNQSVMLVRVEKGKKTPYATTTPNNEIFVRRGATSRRPEPHTELPALFQR